MRRVIGKLSGMLFLFLTCGLLLPPAYSHAQSLVSRLPGDIRILIDSGFHERKIEFYGDNDRLGYGYLEKIVSLMPDKKVFPVTRYRNYAQNVHILLPDNRTEMDANILVGIDLLPEDLKLQHVANAQRLNAQIAQPHASLWAFTTIHDFDTLKSLKLRFDTQDAGSPFEMTISLLHSPNNPAQLAKWHWANIFPEDEIVLNLDPPFAPFSFSRGATPFILAIEVLPGTNPPPVVQKVEVWGIKIDLSGYVLIDRTNGTLTAIKSDFLKRIQQQRLIPWRRFVEAIQNV